MTLKVFFFVENEVPIFKTLIFFELNPTFI